MLLALLRHGEVIGKTNVLRGWSDAPLSEKGWQQMERATESSSALGLVAIASSTSVRCSAFAKHWCTQLNVPLIEDERLREIDFGHWEGLTFDEARDLDRAVFEAFVRAPEKWTSPGGETFAEFRRRVVESLRDLCALGAGPIGVVTHAGVMRIAIADTLGVSFQVAQRCALGLAATCTLWYEPGERGSLRGLCEGTFA